MDYKIVKREAFTVMGYAKIFNYDEGMTGDKFMYMIADDYVPKKSVPDDLITKVIQAHIWAVFPSVGPTKQKLKEINQKIFTEWLPNCKDYEIAEGYNIEKYWIS